MFSIGGTLKSMSPKVRIRTLEYISFQQMKVTTSMFEDGRAVDSPIDLAQYEEIL